MQDFHRPGLQRVGKLQLMDRCVVLLLGCKQHTDREVDAHVALALFGNLPRQLKRPGLLAGAKIGPRQVDQGCRIRRVDRPEVFDGLPGAALRH